MMLQPLPDLKSVCPGLSLCQGHRWLAFPLLDLGLLFLACVQGKPAQPHCMTPFNTSPASPYSYS
eukprot:scaffold89_cov318-Pavlova_lutheri.AAC.5